MPSFDTPEPISVTSHVEAGTIRFTTGDRLDTVVEVRPHEAGKDQDLRTAEQTKITYTNGVLAVRTPKANLFGRTGTVDITVELPAGSRIDLTGGWVQVLGEGRFGEVRVKTSSGEVRLGTTGPLHAMSPNGSISVDRIEGRADITTSTGDLYVGLVDGPAALQNAHGGTRVDEAADDVRASSAHGDIEIRRAEASVTLSTTNGTVRVGEVARGTVRLETSYGAIEVGVREGTAAWLDVSSGYGRVRNTLATSEPPGKTEETVEVLARTQHGNIDILRATA